MQQQDVHHISAVVPTTVSDDDDSESDNDSHYIPMIAMMVVGTWVGWLWQEVVDVCRLAGQRSSLSPLMKFK